MQILYEISFPDFVQCLQVVDQALNLDLKNFKNTITKDERFLPFFKIIFKKFNA